MTLAPFNIHFGGALTRDGGDAQDSGIDVQLLHNQHFRSGQMSKLKGRFAYGNYIFRRFAHSKVVITSEQRGR